MRLIDADLLGVTDFELVLCSGDYKELCKTLIAKVESAPTIDAVPVVRCADCKKWGTMYCTVTMGEGKTTQRFYCADGKRKDGADKLTDGCDTA